MHRCFALEASIVNALIYAFLQLDGNDTQSHLSIELEKVRLFY